MGRGIDYGLGQTNIDKTTGIRYGVISQHAVLQAWADSSEPDYGDPTCPKCGGDAIDIGDSTSEACKAITALDEHAPDCATNEQGGDKGDCNCCASNDTDNWESAAHECSDYACDHCRYVFGPESAFGDEPNSYNLDDGEYKATCGESGDIFIILSPYYTRAAFCSPCAPGACSIDVPRTDGERAYCFAADFFDDETVCPYPVYRVSDDVCVYTPPTE